MDKHNANLCILQILQKHTAMDPALSQQDVLRYLKEEYDLTIDRRSVKSNIEFLQEAGFEIETRGGYRLLSRQLEDADRSLKQAQETVPAGSVMSKNIMSLSSLTRSPDTIPAATVKLPASRASVFVMCPS